MNEGELSGRLGLRGWPAVAEEAIIARDVPARRARRLAAARLPRLDRRLGRDHPLGQEQGLERHRRGHPAPPAAHRRARARRYDPIYKVNPPLRSQADVEALRAGLADGTIDVVATDHAPHPLEDKDCEWAGRRHRHARPGDRAVGRAADDGRHRPARLGRGRRADVGQARRDRPARRPRPPDRRRRAGQPRARRPERDPGGRLRPRPPRSRATRRTPAASCPARVVATFLRGRPHRARRDAGADPVEPLAGGRPRGPGPRAGLRRHAGGAGVAAPPGTTSPPLEHATDACRRPSPDAKVGGGARYVGTTVAGDWLDRVVARGLGAPERVPAEPLARGRST